MTWWCVASKSPWEWAWTAYPGVWLTVLALALPYIVSVRRRARSGAGRVPRRTLAAFAGGVLVVWVASDWPIGTLGAGYLACAHMLQYLLYAFIAAPLLLLGTPEWMARRILGRLRLYRAVRFISVPLRAGVFFNVVLLATHSPLAVDNLRTTQAGSFLMDVVWLLSGLVLWLPIVSPLPELKPASYPVRMVYLFLAGGVMPMFPGGFLTFSGTPLYSLYELAPRVGGFSALGDQQLAGAIMKVGNIPIIWPVIYALFHHWYTEERRVSERARTSPEAALDTGWVVTPGATTGAGTPVPTTGLSSPSGPGPVVGARATGATTGVSTGATAAPPGTPPGRTAPI